MDQNLKDIVMLPVRGFVTLNVFRKGKLIDCWQDRNLVVNGSKPIQAQLLGGSFTGNNITQIGFGSGLTAAAAGNTGLTTPFLKALDGVTYPATGQVCFAFSLASAKSNGLSIGEFGLFAANGTLFARKVRFGALVKDTDIALSGTWTIIF